MLLMPTENGVASVIQSVETLPKTKRRHHCLDQMLFLPGKETEAMMMRYKRAFMHHSNFLTMSVKQMRLT